MSGGPGAPSERPPDLLFCRDCGGSIPRRDFLAGRALLVEGRAWCNGCSPRMLARRRTGRAVLGAAAVAGAVAFALALRALLAASLDAGEAAREASLRAARAEEAAAGAEARLLAAEDGIRGLSRVLGSLGRAVEEARRDGAALGDREERLEAVEAALGTLHDAVEGLREEVAALRSPGGLKEAEEKDLHDRLQAPNAGERFEALWRLRAGKGPWARAAAVKGLSDPEDVVRCAAARLAGALGVKEAEPALVDCLEHPGTAVRAEAIAALRALEGEDLGFDPLEPSREKRAAAVLRWRERVAPR